MRCLVFLTIAGALCADTRTVRKYTTSGEETVVDEYRKGNKIRTETVSRAHNTPPAIRIVRLDEKVTYIIDPQSRKYMEEPKPDFISTLAMSIMRRPQPRVSGKTLDIYYETTDTGERKQILGRSAKHLIVKERRVAEPGACGESRQTESEGWYVDGLWDSSGSSSSHMLISASGFCQDKIVVHGRLPTGTPVRQTAGRSTIEILEISNAALDPSLFEVPRGFEKVERLPGQEGITASRALAWAQLHLAIASWFR